VPNPVVLDALAQAVRAGEDHVARQALRGTDPAMAWWYRRRVAAHIRWASSCLADSSDRLHVLRLAFLREVGPTDDLVLEDRAAVEAAFRAAVEKSAAAPPKRMWWASLAALALVVALAAGGYVLLRPPPPGFRPSDTPLGAALGQNLTDYVSALYRSRDQRRKGGEASADFATPGAALLQQIEASLGAPGRSAFDKLLQSYREGVLQEREEPATRDGLGSSLLASNAALRASAKPYLLDIIYDPRSGPILTSHYVARQRTVRAEGATIPIFRVQRLDTINRALAVLGYTRPQLGAAIVTLDQLESQVVIAIAPALVEKGVARLADSETEEKREDWVQPLEARAGEVLRREYASMRTTELDRIIALLARRDQLFGGFRSAVASTGVVLIQPSTLVSRAPLGVLEGRMPDSELREWREINDELAREPMQRAFDELMDRYARSVDRHEVQHQIDMRRGGLIVIPAELRQLLRMPETMDVDPYGAAAQCRDELSAYLASIATGGDQAVSALVQAANIFFSRSDWGTPHAYAAAVMLTTIARALGIEQEGELGGGGYFDRRRGKEVFSAIAERPTPAVAAAARTAYEKLFGSKIPDAELGPWQEATAWRR
jgi:hypothetical protein